MTFTKEPPTKPGAYWWRQCEGKYSSLLQVNNRGLAFRGCNVEGLVEDLGGEWCRLVPEDELKDTEQDRRADGAFREWCRGE